MSDTSDSDDEGGWPFLRSLLITSLIDDLWGMDYGMVGSTTGSRDDRPRTGARDPPPPGSRSTTSPHGTAGHTRGNAEGVGAIIG